MKSNAIDGQMIQKMMAISRSTKPMLHVYLIPTRWNVMRLVCTQSHLQNVLNAHGQFSKFSQIADRESKTEPSNKKKEIERMKRSSYYIYLKKFFFCRFIFLSVPSNVAHFFLLSYFPIKTRIHSFIILYSSLLFFWLWPCVRVCLSVFFCLIRSVV